MDTPTFADYVALISTMFVRFLQHRDAQVHRGHPFVYQHQVLIVFFTVMQQRHIVQFKTQHRWLVQHTTERQLIGLTTVPNRTTLSRRFKALYPVIQDFVAFLGRDSAELGQAFTHQHLYADKSLFKAHGPVWHQADRQAGRVPHKLRHLDQDATWSKSGYHGWVYGYGLHLVCNRSGFPVMVQVETGSVAESLVLDAQEAAILETLRPTSLSADNSYTQARRIRAWARQQVILLTPALKWQKGRYATAYHRFIRQPEMAAQLKRRRSAIEPVFDLLAKILATTARQKQLPIQKLANVRTCLALAVLTLQVAMIANSIWDLPIRNISTLAAACT
jgi:Transposase DDE domain